MDSIKNEGKPEAFAKSRLVVQGFNDKKNGLLTHAPTAQRFSQRLLLALAMILPEWNIYLRDISQVTLISTVRCLLRPYQSFVFQAIRYYVLTVHSREYPNPAGIGL